MGLWLRYSRSTTVQTPITTESNPEKKSKFDNPEIPKSKFDTNLQPTDFCTAIYVNIIN